MCVNFFFFCLGGVGGDSIGREVCFHGGEQVLVEIIARLPGGRECGDNDKPVRGDVGHYWVVVIVKGGIIPTRTVANNFVEKKKK